jgi:tRNA threonylcarbamoyladenosine biosynthesis protein TsaB
MHKADACHDLPDRPRLLIIETSSRQGLVALAKGEQLLGERRLDEARRHARDLVPAMRDLLALPGWKARDLHGVIVSLGPGSYTGLRVGVMSAKTHAYAAGCALLGVETFAAIALQAPSEALTLDVIADAQQDKLYVQRFVRQVAAERFAVVGALSIQTLAAWQTTLTALSWVSGPGTEKIAAKLPASVRAAPADTWFPRPSSLLQLGLGRFRHGDRDDPIALEPIYLRPSSAEEKLQATAARRFEPEA